MTVAWRGPCSFGGRNPRSRNSLIEGREFLEGNGRKREGRREKWEEK